MDKFVVPSLQKLAFEASFRSVIKAVLEFSDYQPGDKRPADPFLMAREDFIACVRDHLNGPPVLGIQKFQVFHLIDSTLSDTIRLVSLYIKLYHICCININFFYFSPDTSSWKGFTKTAPTSVEVPKSACFWTVCSTTALLN